MGNIVNFARTKERNKMYIMDEKEKDAYISALIDVRRMLLGMLGAHPLAKEVAIAITEMINESKI